jgi:uncharacterized membrane protein
MRPHYNQIAGQNLERLAALSDGIFAVAMTLLVLDLHAPASNMISSEHDLWNALVQLSPNLITYFMSFLTLGMFWIAQQTQLDRLARSNRVLTWIHLAFLLAVSLMPFSTKLLAAFITSRLSVVIYWLNLLLLCIPLFVSIRYAHHFGLVKEEKAVELHYEHRILVAEAAYTFAMALCIISTYISVALIILVQCYYAIGPRIRLVDRF